MKQIDVERNLITAMIDRWEITKRQLGSTKEAELLEELSLAISSNTHREYDKDKRDIIRLKEKHRLPRSRIDGTTRLGEG